MPATIDRLTSGPIDIVGDVHGELSALNALLDHLGYDAEGHHPQGRHLVFVGDLCDRGEDSPGVVRRVMGLVASGAAQAIIGNHEINLLRGEHKHGNGWFYGDPAHGDAKDSDFRNAPQATTQEQQAFLSFFGRLPVALEREDLRVVHACWHPPSIERLREAPPHTADAFAHFEAAISAELETSGIKASATSALAQFATGLKDSRYPMPNLPDVGTRDALKQMGNPLRVLTSGIERPTPTPFFSSGEWRFVERVCWWDEYDGDVPVVVGHYWRWAAPIDRDKVDKGGPDLFEGLGVTEWHGKRKNVFCVDYSAGRRFMDRRQKPPKDNPACRLGALRFPECVVVFDDGGSSTTSDLICR